MAQSRLLLHDILKDILGSDHVYFQPPATLTIVHPCIVYERSQADTKFADNSPYRYTKRYQVTHIDRDPDSLIPDKIAALPMCTHLRFFTAGNLNHDVFYIYF